MKTQPDGNGAKGYVIKNLDTAATLDGEGLTTTRAPFIERAAAHGERFIEQPYSLYSLENHRAWNLLYRRMEPCWRQYANAHFLKGIDSLCLNPDRVPSLEDVNRFLSPLTGFRARAVSGYIPAFQFFDCLRNREFPTTVTIRSPESLDYLPEPDIFHDIAGHVPMHTDPAFASTLVQFGECAHTAVEIASRLSTEEEKERCLGSIIKAMARFFWFTIEFGLMENPTGTSSELKVYGSGLLSSHAEIEHAVRSPEVQRYPLQFEWVINQAFEIDHFQPLLFSIRSFDHLHELVQLLEAWMREGKLNNVAPGEPFVSPDDVKSFLHAAV